MENNGKDKGKGKGKLYAIADLHLGYKFNADALAALRDTHRDDGLILAGDLGERVDEHLRPAFAWATSRFRRVWWCPGNHELYSLPESPSSSSRVPGGQQQEKPPVLRGQEKYDACVAAAREYGVLTPEDPFVVWDGEGLGVDAGEDGKEGEEEKGPIIVCPLFTLYDYSFAPDDVPKGKELDWAAEQDICATDEALLHPDPYPTRQAWCEALVARFERKLEDAIAAATAGGEGEETEGGGDKTTIAATTAAAAEVTESTESTESTTATTTTSTPPSPTNAATSSSSSSPSKPNNPNPNSKPKPKPKPRLILINHWPLLSQLVYLPAIPRFRIWCGTRRTAGWAARFGAAVAVSGHLHIRRTDWVDGVRYEECSLGYPRQWERARNAGRDINAFLREILPGPRERPGGAGDGEGGSAPTKWWIYGDA
ncbi:hypothetical protein SLS62_001443 [Diatrype stigma]|uniref:Calcineurin-like phosphoesterase domain-containing protein n=1 Tax=Diatrype stigma TaxID=117547 RepID=A0AAN9YTK1_9PEZI